MIYIILPLQKESRRILGIIDGLRSSTGSEEIKIIIVNDGGCDETLKQLNTIKEKNVIVISRRIRMGMGADLSAGILGSLELSNNDNDIVIAMDSGYVNEQQLFQRFILGIKEGNDIAIASRYKQGGGYVNFQFLRKIYSCVVNRLLHLIFPINGVNDYTIFLRAYRMGVLREAVNYYGKYGLVQARGFTSNAELLVKLSFLTGKIIEVPFLYDLRRNETRNRINFFETINEYIVIINYLRRIAKKLEAFKRRSAR